MELSSARLPGTPPISVTPQIRDAAVVPRRINRARGGAADQYCAESQDSKTAHWPVQANWALVTRSRLPGQSGDAPQVVLRYDVQAA